MVALLPGFEVAGEADSGEASVEAARVLRPDLVLVDMHLPGIDGPEATRRILACAQPGGPVVLLLSTYDAADCGRQAVACGAAAYLPKAEFGPAALRAAWLAASASGPAS